MPCMPTSPSGTVLWSALLPTGRETEITRLGTGARRSCARLFAAPPQGAGSRRKGVPVTTTQPRVTDYLRDQLGPPLVLIGGFFRMCVLTGKALFRFPFQWKEFILQCWFILRVAILPTMAVSVPITALFIFTFNILLIQVGAADLSGAGAGIAVITQIGPLNTVLVIAGAVSTAICADLGARTIREEIDAMQVLGIDPIHRLVVPRVLASTFVALLLNGLVSAIGIAGGYVFSVLLQGVNPGAFVNGLTVLTHLGELVLSEFKALLF